MDIKYPNSHFEIDIEKFQQYIAEMEPAKIGSMMNEISRKCVHGEFEYLEQFDWIGEISTGEEEANEQ